MIDEARARGLQIHGDLEVLIIKFCHLVLRINSTGLGQFRAFLACFVHLANGIYFLE